MHISKKSFYLTLNNEYIYMYYPQNDPPSICEWMSKRTIIFVHPVRHYYTVVLIKESKQTKK